MSLPTATPANPDPGTAAHGPPTQSHAGACEGRLLRQRLALGELFAMDLPDVSLAEFEEARP